MDTESTKAIGTMVNAVEAAEMSVGMAMGAEDENEALAGFMDQRRAPK